MKVHIIYQIKEGPYGGANQFLKAIKKHLIKINAYTENEELADIFLFNSYNEVMRIMELKKKYPNKIFVQRLDGPSRLHSGNSDKRDLVATVLGEGLADATVFQSNYSKEANYQLGFKGTEFDVTILNAVDETLFYKKEAAALDLDKKIKLIATSWSPNYNKGFDIYEYLDSHLDFNRYEMTFVGNSPIKFHNIHYISPKNSKKLGEIVREHDIYIAASKKESCSNSLIEALSCGLPAVVLKDGGNPEIVKNGGVCFENKEKILQLIDKVSNKYEYYQEQISLLSLEETGNKYYNFLNDLPTKMQSKNVEPKKMTFLKQGKIKGAILILKVNDKIKRIKERLG